MIILRPYQADVIERVRDSMRTNSRIILQSHVGSGKTVMAAEIIRRAVEKQKSVLFIAPRRQLIYQAVETLKSYDINCGVIMAGENRFTQPLVQVASIDTITARVGSGRMAIPKADLCICDEAHMMASPARIAVLKTFNRVIGLTATPALANGKGLGFFYDDIVESLTMAEMVEQDHLVPMRYFIGNAADVSGVKLNADGEYQEKALAQVTDTPDLIGDVFTNWYRLASDRTTLIFAINRSHARHIHDEFMMSGINSEYIDGETPPEERERIRQAVEDGSCQVVVNIGVMVAGVNWPRISCVVIARQMRNICNWIQCIGRGSRKHETKSDCLVIYHGSNFDELGMIDEPITWSLDDKTTVRERKEQAKKDRKEPKEITCRDCKYVFKASRVCPKCGCEMVKSGEPIPVHEAELTEIKKVTSEEKERTYQEMLGWCRRHAKRDGLAYHAYIKKFGVGPEWRKIAAEPSDETSNYMRSRLIAYAKSRKQSI